MNRRIARNAALCLILGLATTLIVAAACAWFEKDTQIGYGPYRSWGERLTDNTGTEVVPAVYGQSPPGTMELRLQSSNRRGVTIAIGSLRGYGSFTPAGPKPPPQPTPESIASYWERDLALPWLDGHKPWPADGRDSVWLKAAGWPFRAAYCRLAAVNSSNFSSHTWTAPGGMIIGNATFPGWADWPPILPRVIPCTPLWRGLIADTLIFSLAWWLLFLGPRRLRRALRARRGQCPFCAYDLRGLAAGSPCPECGSASGERQA